MPFTCSGFSLRLEQCTVMMWISRVHGMVKQAVEKKQLHFSVINGSFMDLFSLNQTAFKISSFQFLTLFQPPLPCARQAPTPGPCNVASQIYLVDRAALLCGYKTNDSTGQ